jgi:hypothetical protein
VFCCLSIFGASHDGIGALPHQGIEGFVSAEVTNEDDKMILECLEHVNFYGSVIFKASLLLS